MTIPCGLGINEFTLRTKLSFWSKKKFLVSKHTHNLKGHAKLDIQIFLFCFIFELRIDVLEDFSFEIRSFTFKDKVIIFFLGIEHVTFLLSILKLDIFEF